MVITKDKFVAFNYVLKDADGVELDSSAGTTPLGYVHGRGYLIPGLEAQLEGKAPGDKFSCTIQPKDGYGERDERLVTELPRDRFDTDVEIEIEMKNASEFNTTGLLLIVSNKTGIKAEELTIYVKVNDDDGRVEWGPAFIFLPHGQGKQCAWYDAWLFLSFPLYA